MSDVRIKVGVALDANASAVLAPLETAVKRTRRTVSDEMAASGKAMASETANGARAAAAAAKAAGKAIEAEEKRKQAIIRTSSEMAGRYAAQAAKEEVAAARTAARERVQIAKQAARDIAAARRADERRQSQSLFRRDLLTGKALSAGGGAIGIGRRAGIRTSRGLALGYGLAGSAASSMTSIGLDFAHGLGYDTDLGSHIRAAKDERGLATKISNAGYVPGTALTDPSEILAKAREVGNATGTDTTEALDALRAFVGKTGDLKTGMDTLGQMATLSKATGTHLEDMANAAAEVTNQLGDIPNKGNVVYTIMKQIAGQGKLGAVEIRDLAVQMAKIGAASSRFAGGAEQNISTLGVIAQEAKLRGGASSASQAAQSVVAFAGGFATKATFKNWRTFKAPVPGHPGKFEGLNPFTDNSHTELSDPMTLIKAALSATRGDQTKLATLFPSKQGFRAVAGFANVYNQAAQFKAGDAEAKNAAGIEAVTAEFARLKEAQLTDEEVHRAFAATMRLGDSKAAIFNNKMTEIAEKLTTAVLPSLDSFGTALVNSASTAAGYFEMLFPEGKRDQQTEEGKALLGQGSKAVAALDKTATTDLVYDATSGGFKQKKIYSGEAVDVAKSEFAKSNASAAALATQANQEKQEAAEARRPGAAFGLLGDWVGKQYDQAVGNETKADKAERLAKQGEADAATSAQLLSENQKASSTLGQILRAINDQTAAIKAPPPPEHDPAGRAPADADTEDK
jgi:hypothetical protein